MNSVAARVEFCGKVLLLIILKQYQGLSEGTIPHLFEQISIE